MSGVDSERLLTFSASPENRAELVRQLIETGAPADVANAVVDILVKAIDDAYAGFERTIGSLYTFGPSAYLTGLTNGMGMLSQDLAEKNKRIIGGMIKDGMATVDPDYLKLLGLD